MDQLAKILQFIERRGPVIPNQIRKEIGVDSILAGAMLSSLVSKGKLKISHAKIGGSPVYYIKGQESKLEILYRYLHEKQQRAYNLLKNEKILEDTKLEPVTRVALRQLKDFAVPVEVVLNRNKTFFWKWHLLTNEDIAPIIKQKLGLLGDKKDEKEDALDQTKKLIEEIKKEREKKKEVISKPDEKKLEKIEKPKKPIKPIKPIKPVIQKTITGELKEIKISEHDHFAKDVKKYFDKNKMSIINLKTVRKNSELEAIIEIPSAVGSLRYFCKAKSKAKINDGDLSSVFISAQMKKMPGLLLIQGGLTKKAKELLNKEFLSLKVKRIK